MKELQIGEMVKVKGQCIRGKVVRIHPNTEVVIEDEDAESSEDNQLCFKFNEIEEN